VHVRRAHGSAGVVEAVSVEARPETMYTLTVDGELGAGALIYRSWSVLRGEAGQAPPPPPMMPATP
jgi:hypothetical protein